MVKNNQKQSFTVVIGVLATFLIGQIGMIMNPVMATLAAEYAEIPYTSFLYITTITTVGQTICSFLSGSVVGNRIRYKTALTGSILLIIVAALIPAFVHSFPVLCIARLLCGCGIGLASPLGAALVMRIFTGQQAANMMGISQTAANLSGMAYQMVAGMLAVRGMHTVWYFHLVLLIPLVLIWFFMPEPEKVETAPAAAESVPDAPQAKIGTRGYLAVVGYTLMVLAAMPMMVNISALLVEENIGDASTAGIVLAIYSLGGIASFVFGPIYKVLKSRAIVLGVLMAVAGVGIVSVSGQPVLLMVGMFLSGLATFLVMSGILTDVGKDLAPGAMGRLSSLLIVGVSVAGMLCPPFIQLAGGINPSIRFSIQLGFYALIVIAVIWVIANTYFAKKSR